MRSCLVILFFLISFSGYSACLESIRQGIEDHTLVLKDLTIYPGQINDISFIGKDDTLEYALKIYLKPKTGIVSGHKGRLIKVVQLGTGQERMHANFLSKPLIIQAKDFKQALTSYSRIDNGLELYFEIIEVDSFGPKHNVGNGIRVSVDSKNEVCTNEESFKTSSLSQVNFSQFEMTVALVKNSFSSVQADLVGSGQQARYELAVETIGLIESEILTIRSLPFEEKQIQYRGENGEETYYQVYLSQEIELYSGEKCQVMIRDYVDPILGTRPEDRVICGFDENSETTRYFESNFSD